MTTEANDKTKLLKVSWGFEGSMNYPMNDEAVYVDGKRSR